MHFCRPTPSALAPFALALALVTTSAPARADDEAQSYGVDNFDGTGQCNPNSGEDDDLQYAVAQADAFDDVLDDWNFWGLWDTSHVLTNGSVTAVRMTDADLPPTFGDDVESNAGIDEPDIAYISSHGNSVCSEGDSYIDVEMGSSADECDPDTTAPPGVGGTQNFFLGDGDLEIAILDTCQSAQFCAWDTGALQDLPGSSFRMWAGFHGKSWDRDFVVPALEDYVIASRLAGVGDNWLTYRYEPEDVNGDELCPVAVIYASSEGNATGFYDDAGLGDRISTGGPSTSYYFYIPGCDPGQGNPVE